tara:strand:+ start:699 stop:1454 length:756 start_codon:yes stop_codon:yes gene_type:complete
MFFSLSRKLSFLIKKSSDFFSELALFLKKSAAKIHPYTSINNLDKQIAEIIPSLLCSETFYVEVGANDGLTQSNTYFLEKIYGAKGMLIEASPSLFEKCCINRAKRNIFEHYALVDDTYNKSFVELHYGDLWTTSIESSDVIPKEHAKLGLVKPFFKRLFRLPSDPVYNFFSPAATLNSLIKKHCIERIDLLSLDVEGNELLVLQGSNLNRGIIKNILIESRNHERITEYLSDYGYSLSRKLSHHDYLYSL